MKRFKFYYLLNGNGFDGRDIEVEEIEARDEYTAKSILIKNRPDGTYLEIIYTERKR